MELVCLFALFGAPEVQRILSDDPQTPDVLEIRRPTTRDPQRPACPPVEVVKIHHQKRSVLVLDHNRPSHVPEKRLLGSELF